MLQTLRTNNFKKLEDFFASFVDGTNLMFGENAQGKSTTFDAIRFALFGSKGVVGTTDSLTTWGKTGMWVELGISDYLIRRTLSNCKITNSDGDVVASGNTPCIRFVEELLGCTLKDFDLLYMSKQSETAGLINFGATELNRKVEEYAGVATIDKIIKELGSEINGVRIALESFEYKDTDQLVKSMDAIEAKGKLLRQTQKMTQEDLEQLKEQLTEVQERAIEVAKHNDEVDRLTELHQRHQKKVAALKARVEVAKAQHEEAVNILSGLTPIDPTLIPKKEAEIEEIESLRHKLNRLGTVDKYDKAIANAEAKLSLVSTYQTQLEAVQSEFDDAEAWAAKCQSELHDAEAADKDALRTLLEAERLVEEGVCSACDRPFEDHDPEAAKAKAKEAKQVRIDALKACSNANQEYLEADQRFKNCKRKLQAIQKQNPGTGWEEALEEAKAEKASYIKSVQDLESKLSQCRDYNGLVRSLKMDEQQDREYKRADRELFKRLNTLNSESQNLADALAEGVPVIEPKKDNSELMKQSSELTKQKDELQSSLTELSAKLATKLEQHKSLKTELASAQANNTKMAELEKQHDTAKQLRKYLNDERVKFMEGVWRTILGTATNFINKSTEGWISAVGRNDKGEFTFTENGNEAVAKESASGAQKAFIGTAIKVGLAQAKNGASSMVLLDEPTADMRDDRASQLAAGLMMLSGQKLMITHRDSERMIAQNIIQVGD